MGIAGMVGVRHGKLWSYVPFDEFLCNFYQFVVPM